MATTAEVLPAPARPPPWQEFASAPLVPVALAATLGILVDRFAGGSVVLGLSVAFLGVLAWKFVRHPHAVGCLWLAFAGLGLAHHHAHLHEFPADDVGQEIGTEKRFASVRGILVDDPVTKHRDLADPMMPARRHDLDSTVLEINALETSAGTWRPATGRVRLWVEHVTTAEPSPPMMGLQAGDSVQVVGQWRRPRPPGNPGERDANDALRNQRLRGELRVAGNGGAITRWDSAPWGYARVLATARRRGTSTLNESLPAKESHIARALLLGDGSALERSEWDAFMRTGVVHVLVISGQHLVLLAGFVWLILGLFGVPRRRAAWAVTLVIVAYALLTGFRPSSVRAAVMVVLVCGAIILRRRVHTANCLALAWLVILALNPTDVFDLGCQLSFLSVFTLIYGVGIWVAPRRLTPLEQLIDSTRPAWWRLGRSLLRAVGVAYFVNFVLFLANTPILIAQQNVVSPVGLLVGPILVVLTSVALVAGFLLFLVAPLPGVGELLAAVTRLSLSACDTVVHAADGLPGGVSYLPGLPMWWLLGFYALTVTILLRGVSNSRWLILGWLAWVLIGLIAPTADRPNDELRITFLAVGHGGCAVLETPDGRCLLYDVGTTGGPDVIRRVVAPYLWSRGIRRVDEVFVSHADADHFNGLIELMQRFPVGRVTFTPSFAEKPTPQVAETMLALKKRNVETRTVTVGQTFTAGTVDFEVLHPPPVGPPGIENERSLVLLIRHAEHTVLLTGDIEKAGAAQLLGRPAQRVDVLQAPHHGSRAAFSPLWKTWADPKFLAVSRGDLYTNFIREADYGSNVTLWETETHGAITLRSHRTGLTAEAFRTGERRVVVRNGG